MVSGPKLMLAIKYDKHDTIVGRSCVAMCVNDIIMQCGHCFPWLRGGRKNEPAKPRQVVAGVAEGCVQAGAVLIGGKRLNHHIICRRRYGATTTGFAVGVAEKSQIIDGSK